MQEDNSSTIFRYDRKSIRLATHDYTWTRSYFVTIKAKVKEPLFEIPELRTILQETWEALPQRFPGVSLDEIVIMPDHVHFIICLNALAENAPTLGRVVGAYKSLTTVAWIHHIQAAKLPHPGTYWQRNFFDRIIRNPNELEKARQYIRNNPVKLEQRQQ